MSPGFRLRPSLSVEECGRALDGGPVSPGFRPRPSLSADIGPDLDVAAAGVAGVQAPRPSLSAELRGRRGHTLHVSPGFRPRPSLSADCARRRGGRGLVSPGFRPRPSLSVVQFAVLQVSARRGVAGVQAPAFVERASSNGSPTRRSRVARG